MIARSPVGRDRQFGLKYSKSYQSDSSDGGGLRRPHSEMREVKTVVKHS
jgi:hypothetical protein